MEPSTVLLYGEDAGSTYFFWQWIEPDIGEPRVHVIDPGDLHVVLAELDDALPRGVGDEFTRRLASSALCSIDAERALSERLSRVLLHPDFVQELLARESQSGMPVTVRLLPPPSCVRVPWELLTLDARRRLVSVADVSLDVPAGLLASRVRHPDSWGSHSTSQPVLYVIDPLFPGRPSILDAHQQAAFERRRPVAGAPRPGSMFTRAHFASALTSDPPPGRLLYVGHIETPDQLPENTSMSLSDRDSVFGVGPTATHDGRAVSRPFTALDAVEGTLYSRERNKSSGAGVDPGDEPRSAGADVHEPLAGADIWPMPPRVALIACESGSDFAGAEPFGLVSAFISAGAELVTATRWILPTDHAFRTVSGVGSSRLFDMARTVDDAHDGSTPVSALADWQRRCLVAWERTQGDREALALSPILWAALATFVVKNGENAS